MRPIRIHSAAAQEAEQAAAWYERERPGLGVDFSAAIEAALDRLENEQVSVAVAVGSGGRRTIRRLILLRFPYDVVFVDRADHVLVLAFAHHSRRPGFWRDRMGR
jgi:hypothetical protein